MFEIYLLYCTSRVGDWSVILGSKKIVKLELHLKVSRLSLVVLVVCFSLTCVSAFATSVKL
jgi:hypothetical protein